MKSCSSLLIIGVWCFAATFVLLAGTFPALAARTVSSADGVPIQYDVHGDGQPALVFVHCWCCDRSYWDAQIEPFAQQYTVVTLDLAGHGASGAEREAWTIEAFGADVAAVVNALGLKQVVLVGHSMGGPVTIEAARRLPDQVIGLIAIDTLHDLEEHYTLEQVEEFLAPFRDNFAAATEGYIRQMMFTPDSDPALIAKVAGDMSSAPPEIGIGAMQAVGMYYAADAVQEVAAPVWCINSDKFPTNVEAGRRHARSFELVIIPGVGHFPMLEAPDTFNAMLADVVQKLVTATE